MEPEGVQAAPGYERERQDTREFVPEALMRALTCWYCESIRILVIVVVIFLYNHTLSAQMFLIYCEVGLISTVINRRSHHHIPLPRLPKSSHSHLLRLQG